MDFILEGIVQGFKLILSMDEETVNIVITTIKLTALSMFWILALGLPLGFFIGYHDFFGKYFIRHLVDIMLSLPTVVIGLLVYAFISRSGPFGKYELLFTIKGMAIGQLILGLPIVIAYTATVVQELDSRLKMTLQTVGASGFRLAMTSLWESRFQILVASLTSYGRIIGEVGSAMMLGGNIKWHTRTITTAISLETGKGDFALGIALGVILISISITLNLALTFIRRRTERAQFPV